MVGKVIVHDGSQPSLLGYLFLGAKAWLEPFKQLRAFFCVFLAACALSLLPVLDLLSGLHSVLDHVPLASGRAGRFLFEDVERLHPELSLSVGGSALLAMLLWTFFAGGVVSIGDKEPSSSSLGGFLANCGKRFFVSFRTWVIFVLHLLLWTWVVVDFGRDALAPRFGDLANAEYSMYVDLAVNLLWLLGFAVLLIVRRLALARIVVFDKKSAILSFYTSLLLLIRRPLRMLLAWMGFGLLVMAVVLALGFLSDRLFLSDDRQGLAFGLSLVALFFLQGSIFASFRMARVIWSFEPKLLVADENPET